MSEGNILVLRDTLLNNHDLIMIVGKEPNNAEETVNRIDTYGESWDEKGKGKSCQFWNMAYSLCGDIAGYNCASLKGFCALKKTSPIVFSDISPLSLNGSFSSHKKKKLRAQISEAEYVRHVESIFSHKNAISRVKLVVFTGAYGCGLTVGRTYFEKKCDELNLKHVNIASLNSTSHTIKSRVEEIGANADVISKAFEGLNGM